MPSHIAHSLFAEDTFHKASVSHLIETFPNTVTFAAQGPDIFYHNRRTKPTSTFLGLQIHRRKYGTLVSKMTESALEKGVTFHSPVGAYIAAYITHAFLDRRIHPFINFFAGWFDPSKPETKKYLRCHVFFERIIDVFLLQKNKHCTPNEFDFYSRVDLGETFPGTFLALLSKAFNTTYQDEELSERTKQRIKNAYTDAMGFYRWTNYTSTEYFQKASQKEQEGLISNRWHALVHPINLPHTVDFMNDSHTPWMNPCNDQEKNSESFWDLYNTAIDDTVPVIEALREVFEGRIAPEALGQLIGDHSLSDEDHGPCDRQFSRPLPLSEILDTMHQDFKPLIQ
jgi:hypothetical protein